VKAEQVLKLAVPEITTAVMQHLAERHGVTTPVTNVRAIHHQVHGVAPVKEWKSVWSCWTVVPHPHP
jgi:hypothetical protein